MSKKHFTDQDIATLSKNPHVKRVSSKGITYADSFKQFFIREYKEGKLPRDIFEEAGFDVRMIGIHRVKAAYQAAGIMGLTDTRKDHSGRPSVSEPTLEEKHAKMKLLEAENELLKKIQRLERRLEK